jgi:2-oxo-4-hydroxy-4-carboxy-5-ureidoimidazoline decarboxylase
MKYSLADLNEMSQETFVTVLGDIFEDTPAIAQKAWNRKPFQSIDDLHQSMVDVVKSLTKEEQLALIKAHPDLGSKAKMAEASVQEQAGVGLDRLTPDEYNRIHSLNQAYKDKFGFPFIVAVKNHTQASIFDEFIRRLQNSPPIEQQQALSEIFAIAKFRLLAIIA